MVWLEWKLSWGRQRWCCQDRLCQSVTAQMVSCAWRVSTNGLLRLASLYGFGEGGRLGSKLTGSRYRFLVWLRLL
jgi:hypothetical protein